MSDVNNLLLDCGNIFHTSDRADRLVFECCDLNQTSVVHVVHDRRSDD